MTLRSQEKKKPRALGASGAKDLNACCGNDWGEFGRESGIAAITYCTWLNYYGTGLGLTTVVQSRVLTISTSRMRNTISNLPPFLQSLFKIQLTESSSFIFMSLYCTVLYMYIIVQHQAFHPQDV
jgi:hypothetical protein